MDRDPKRPNVTDRALAQQQARAEREAAALRANLRKRKEQARARQDDGERTQPETGGNGQS